MEKNEEKVTYTKLKTKDYFEISDDSSKKFYKKNLKLGFRANIKEDTSKKQFIEILLV